MRYTFVNNNCQSVIFTSIFHMFTLFNIIIEVGRIISILKNILCSKKLIFCLLALILIISLSVYKFLKMVCEKCEKKLGRVITPDPWKSGARNTVESGGRKVGENKALSSGKARFNPYTAKFEICKICRQKVHQVGAHYCQACAYKKAICAMCGKKLMSNSEYKKLKQSSTWRITNQKSADFVNRVDYWANRES